LVKSSGHKNKDLAKVVGEASNEGEMFIAIWSSYVWSIPFAMLLNSGVVCACELWSCNEHSNL